GSCDFTAPKGADRGQAEAFYESPAWTPFSRWESSGRVQSGHRGSEEREVVKEGHHRALCERPYRQEARRGPRRAVRRAAGIQASEHWGQRQGRLPHAARPARAAEEGPARERRGRIPPRPPGGAEEEGGPPEHGVSRPPAPEPED